MRLVFVGAGKLAVMTAKILLKRGHEVVIIEKDKARIDELSEELDCGFLHGDGSKPALLKEAGPKETDMLFCLTGNDQANIIASLVGRSLEFARVITKIEDPELEHICAELGLTDTIIPTSTISRFLADMTSGLDPLELSTMIKGEARFFSFVVGADDAGKQREELGLPDGAQVICYYRDRNFMLADDKSKFQVGDEVVVLTHSEKLPELRERFAPRPKAEEEAKD